MTDEKYETRIFVISYLIGSLIAIGIEHITGFDYNIISDGLNIKSVANLALWMGIWALVHAVLKRLFLKDRKTNDSNKTT